MMNLQNSSESYYPSIMPFFSIEGSNQQSKDQAFVGDLMNRSMSSEPGYPSFMPFYNMEESSKQAPHTTISNSFLNTTQNTQHRGQFSSFSDYSAPLIPLNNQNRYSVSSSVLPEYQTSLMRPFEDRYSYGATATTTPLWLNLNHHHSYFSSSSSTSSFNRMLWRSRGYFFGHQPPRCQAEGCKADLSNAKRYHRRHKVCDFHSKASVVVISGGLQQRFCQQCSRFHSLDEFDEAKKSCRKRLADHNRRRRKPQQPPSPTSTAPNKKKSASQNASETRTTKNSTSACKSSSTDKKVSDKERKHKTTNLKIGSSLSLGGTEKPDMGYISSDHSQLHHHNVSQFSSEKAPEYQFQLDSYRSVPYTDFNQLDLPCPRPNTILESIGENCELPNHHDTGLLHVGHSMFGLDFA